MNDWHFTLKNILLFISSSELHRNLMMLRPRLVLFSIFAFTLSLSPDVSNGRAGKSKHCRPSLCGNVNIRHPFRLKGQPRGRGCDDRRFELECKRNRTIFPMKYGNFYVLNISYLDQSLRLVDLSLVDENCSIPQSFIVHASTTYENGIYWPYRAGTMYLVNCTTRMKSSSVYVDASRCPTNSSSSPWTYFYFPVSFSNISDFHHSCRFIAQFPVMLSNISGLPPSYIYKNLLEGVEVYWYMGDTEWPSNPILKVLLQLVYGLLLPIGAYIESNVVFLLPGIFDHYNYPYGKGTYFVCLAVSAARGTLGYIAPELFYRNIGGISYKADIYSFGMLLMEMVGRRKNLNAFDDHSSQIYFPSWIYDRFEQRENIELGDVTEVDDKIARKMIMVAFWCMQMNPTNRPSMSKVLEMLENELDHLELPSRPSLFSLQKSIEDHVSKNVSKEPSTSKSCVDL
ncbi:hypothetical protein PVK06_010323 [Gossypium arboreum]|uniref:Protein kinase domain-containing protein n=1 Tax=Gossypium arboreum TaxID=29729 RepID=A0ABR0Q6F7_GOSAR|nr:hypothetical protein PVK06_010323 [Gossypium arboreum]